MCWLEGSVSHTNLCRLVSDALHPSGISGNLLVKDIMEEGMTYQYCLMSK
jgi:hypothetical protein